MKKAKNCRYDSVDLLLINNDDYLRSVYPLLLSFLFSATSTIREMRGFEEGNSKQYKTLRVYVTGFWKTDQIVTLGLFHFIGPANGYTCTLHTYSTIT